MMSIAERFTSVREMLHMNRSQFADFLGITGSLVSSMERGIATVSRKTTARMADLLSINPIWMQYGVGDMFVKPDITLESILENNQALKAAYETGIEKEERKIARRQTAAERLKTFRNYIGINQNQLAKRLGYTRAYISAVEKGIQMPSRQMTDLIEAEFGVSSNWLLYGKAA